MHLLFVLQKTPLTIVLSCARPLRQYTFPTQQASLAIVPFWYGGSRNGWWVSLRTSNTLYVHSPQAIIVSLHACVVHFLIPSRETVRSFIVWTWWVMPRVTIKLHPFTKSTETSLDLKNCPGCLVYCHIFSRILLPNGVLLPCPCIQINQVIVF